MSWVHKFNNYFIVSESPEKPVISLKLSEWDYKGSFQVIKNDKVKSGLASLDIKGEYIHKFTKKDEPTVFHVTNTITPSRTSIQLTKRSENPINTSGLKNIKAILNAPYSKDIENAPKKEDVKEKTPIEKAASVIHSFRMQPLIERMDKVADILEAEGLGNMAVAVDMVSDRLERRNH